MADGAMPTKRKRKAEEKPHDGKKKKQKKRGKPAERAPVQEPATGKLGDIFEAMQNSSAISEVTTAEMFDTCARGAGQSLPRVRRLCNRRAAVAEAHMRLHGRRFGRVK